MSMTYIVGPCTFYLITSNRKQRRKWTPYGNFEEILTNVPLGSIQGPLLFNIDICDLFYDIKDLDMASYADDNTPYTSSSEVHDAFIRLENWTVKIFEWFCKNNFKSNVDKCNLVTTSKSQEERLL